MVSDADTGVVEDALPGVDTEEVEDALLLVGVVTWLGIGSRGCEDALMGLRNDFRGGMCCLFIHSVLTLSSTCLESPIAYFLECADTRPGIVTSQGSNLGNEQFG